MCSELCFLSLLFHCPFFLKYFFTYTFLIHLPCSRFCVPFITIFFILLSNFLLLTLLYHWLIIEHQNLNIIKEIFVFLFPLYFMYCAEKLWWIIFDQQQLKNHPSAVTGVHPTALCRGWHCSIPSPPHWIEFCIPQ